MVTDSLTAQALFFHFFHQVHLWYDGPESFTECYEFRFCSTQSSFSLHHWSPRNQTASTYSVLYFALVISMCAVSAFQSPLKSASHQSSSELLVDSNIVPSNLVTIKYLPIQRKYIFCAMPLDWTKTWRIDLMHRLWQALLISPRNCVALWSFCIPTMFAIPLLPCLYEEFRLPLLEFSWFLFFH